MTRKVAAVVLSAGAGTRFGRVKQLALLEGRPLIAHVVAAVHAATTIDEIVVVVGARGDEVAAAVPEDAGAAVIVNPAFVSGQASSLRAGLEALGDDIAAAVVVLADEPGLAPATIDAVVAAWRDGAVAARARYEDRAGHPVIFDRSVWPRLRRLTGDAGARQILAGLEVTEVVVGGPAPQDVDEPTDMERLEARRREDGSRTTDR